PRPDAPRARGLRRAERRASGHRRRRRTRPGRPRRIRGAALRDAAGAARASAGVRGRGPGARVRRVWGEDAWLLERAGAPVAELETLEAALEASLDLPGRG